MLLNVVSPDQIADRSYGMVVIGTGFGSSFFLHEALKRSRGPILVIEWGDDKDHQWQIEHLRNSSVPIQEAYTSKDDKPWNFTIGFGGGTNCWWGQTPRLHPSDFRLRSLYGVGQDWPVTYDTLEPFYSEAEEIMAISGDPDSAILFPRSRPYPQPPHHMSSVDRIMKRAQPDRHFIVPTARARVATETRAACCASARCGLCPVDAKFTAYNGLQHVYGNKRIDVCLRSKVVHLEWQNDAVQAAVFEHGGRQYKARGDLFVLGANAIQSPFILQRSDMGGPKVGKGLHEQVGINVEVFLDGVNNFDGSTLRTGLNYSLYDGEFRRDAASAILYFENRWVHGLRSEYGKWRQTLPMVVLVEDLVEDSKYVTVGQKDGVPLVVHPEMSGYAKRGIDRAMAKLPEVLAPLPVESIHFRKWRETESHLQGTLRMGNDSAESVVDANQAHHRWRNLVIVGTSVFPSCASVNPSLTAAALSLRSARTIL